jgi:hypothetical protein
MFLRRERVRPSHAEVRGDYDVNVLRNLVNPGFGRNGPERHVLSRTQALVSLRQGAR